MMALALGWRNEAFYWIDIQTHVSVKRLLAIFLFFPKHTDGFQAFQKQSMQLLLSWMLV